MSLPEPPDAARALPRDEQLKQANTLLEPGSAVETPIAEYALLATMFPPGHAIEIWSQFEAYEAAYALQALLDEARHTDPSAGPPAER